MHGNPSGGSSASQFLSPPRRVAIAGDWHANTRYGTEAIAHARKRNADVVVHLGDFGFTFTEPYLNALDGALEEHDLVLGFVDGNHENFDWLLAQPIAPDGLRYLRDRIVHLPRGFRWSWGETRCLAVGGAYSIDRILRMPGRAWWPQEVLTADDVRDIAGAGGADVMFCHDCPSGITGPAMDRARYGFPEAELSASEANRAKLRQIVDGVRPRRLWHGHFHHRYQAILEGIDYRTVVDGLGRDKGPIDNNMVVINLDDLGRHRIVG